MKDDMKILCEKLKPMIGERADALWLTWLMGDRKGREQAESIIQLLYTKTFAQKVDTKKTLLVPPPEDTARGRYELGNVVYNNKELYPFGIKNNKILSEHLGIFGRSGSGKTNFLFKLLTEFLKNKLPWWVLDVKRDYRSLINASKDNEILIYTIGRRASPLPFNPLFPPPGTESEIMSYLEKITEIISRAFFVGHGVKAMLKRGFFKIVNDWKQGKGELSFRALLKWINEYQPKNHGGGRRTTDWRESTIRAIEQLCTGDWGLALNTQKPVKVDELLRSNVIFELDGLSRDQRTFFIETILLWVREHRLSSLNTDESDVLKSVLVIEEAHNVLSTGREEAQKQSVLEIALRETRSLGTGIIIIDQTPSLINQVAFSNTYLSLFFSLKGKKDISAAANALLLDTDDKDILGRLPVGMAVCKLQDKWFDPFLIKVPLMDIKRAIVSDQDIAFHMKDKAGYSGSSKAIGPGNKEIGGISESGIEETKLEEKEIRFLLDVVNNQYSGVTSRYKRLKLSSRHGNEIKSKLTKKGLIKVTEIRNKDGWTRLLELTPKGVAKLHEQDIELRYSKPHNGMTHRFYKDKIGKHFQGKGYQVVYEKLIGGGKRVDIEAVKPGERIGIEVETGASNSISDITSLLPLYDKIIFFVTDAKAEQKVRRNALSTDKKVVILNQLN